MVRAMRSLAPGLPRGLTADGFLRQDWPELDPVRRFRLRHLFAAAAVHAGFVAYDVDALPAAAPLALRRFAGLPLLTWTVRGPEQRLRQQRWADQMIFEGFDPEAT
jgi:glycerophosphoryl diester phosphodiesterase